MLNHNNFYVYSTVDWNLLRRIYYANVHDDQKIITKYFYGYAVRMVVINFHNHFSILKFVQ